MSNPSEPGKLDHWRTINGCSCRAWSLGDSNRTRPSALYYSICSLCSAGQLAECRAWVNDPHQSASANFRERAVRDCRGSQEFLRIGVRRQMRPPSAHLCRRPPWPSARRPSHAGTVVVWCRRRTCHHTHVTREVNGRTRRAASRRDDQFGTSNDTASDRCDTELKLPRPSIWGISGGKWPSLR